MGRIGQFFRRAWDGIRGGVRRAVGFVRDKVLPTVSRLAPVVQNVAGAIPHPIGQAIASGAGMAQNIAGKVGNALNNVNI